MRRMKFRQISRGDPRAAAANLSRNLAWRGVALRLNVYSSFKILSILRRTVGDVIENSIKLMWLIAIYLTIHFYLLKSTFNLR